MQEYGTVIATQETPTTTRFSFVISDPSIVRKGRYVQLKGEDGLLVGFVRDIVRSNRYFEHAESISEYEKNDYQSTFLEHFPAGEWEFAVADCHVLGAYDGGTLKRVAYPPAPGTKVQGCEDSVLIKFLGFEEQGLRVGKLFQHNVEVKLNLTKLFQKHLALLAQSGAGKSYSAAVLIEELLSRQKDQGRLAIAVIDMHGEYACFADRRRNPDFANQVEVVPGDKIKIAARRLTTQLLGEFLPDMSPAQLRDLAPVLKKVRKDYKEKEEAFSMKDLIQAVSASEIRDNSKQALLAWLSELSSYRIVGVHDAPHLKRSLKPGKLLVFDFSSIINMKKKQMLVAYLCRKMFNLRRQGELPPYLLLVEEAHNFAPEKVERRSAISRSVIETVAREGRKFGASLCLVSQRPVKLSTTALSQCNSFLIMRVTNPYDLKHIEESCENIDSATTGQITTLKTGEGVLIGEAVSYPVFLKVRERKSQKAAGGTSLEELSKAFEEEEKISEAVSEAEAGEAFL
ncbi:ATP-binding protein [Candidatus Micrarchaeota archaeon]|nr:ATP-binding protein [Candidatus Micrarchaeota archaeon]